MYNLINSNIDLLLNGIQREDHIDPYIHIGKAFNKRENSSPDFKAKYRKFYQLDAARLSSEFCESYFALLEKNRDKEEIDIRDIIEKLYELKCNKKGTHSVHFSFASKLVHTIHSDLPIYDSMVAAFYYFPVKAYWSKDRKIEEYLLSYEFLKREYTRIMDQNILEQSIDKFKNKFCVGEEYSNVKIIDTLIWRYVALLKTGAVRDDHVRYD